MEIPNRPQNLQPNPKKRPSDCNVNIQDSNYFKIRAVLKDLRPHFLEVLRTPDFKTSKAAYEISQQMKVLMKLYEEMTSGTITMEKCKNTTADGVHDQKKSTEVKPTETQPQPPPPQPPVEKTFVRKPSEERPAAEEVTPGSYIVGGSAFGWNFVTYPGSNLAAYYGTSKEDFRAANPIPDNTNVAES